MKLYYLLLGLMITFAGVDASQLSKEEEKKVGMYVRVTTWASDTWHRVTNFLWAVYEDLARLLSGNHGLGDDPGVPAGVYGEDLEKKKRGSDKTVTIVTPVESKEKTE